MCNNARNSDEVTFKSKFSKWLDSLSDARRLQIQQDFEKGIVPPELKTGQTPSIKSSNQSNTPKI